jgi:hypothetical protein
MSHPDSSTPAKLPKLRFLELIYWALGFTLLALVYTVVVPKVYEAEAAIEVKEPPNLLGALPIAAGSSGGTVLDSLDGVVQCETAQYYIFFADQKKWDEMTREDSNPDIENPFKMPQFLPNLKPRDGQVNTIKRQDKQQLLIRADAPTGQQALDLCQKALDITNHISTNSSALPSKVAADRLKGAIRNIEAQLNTQEAALVKIAMKSEAAPSGPQDFFMFQQKFQALKMQLDSAMKSLETVHEHLMNIRNDKGEKPTGVTGIDSLRAQVLMLQQKFDLVLHAEGQGMPDVELLRRQLTSTKKMFATELEKYAKALPQGLDQLWLSLQLQVDSLNVMIEDAAKLLKVLPRETITDTKALRDQKILENTLIELKSQEQEAEAKTLAPDKDWVILDTAHLLPLGKNKPINKNYILNAAIGFLLGAFVKFVVFRLKVGKARGTPAPAAPIYAE